MSNFEGFKVGDYVVYNDGEEEGKITKMWEDDFECEMRIEIDHDDSEWFDDGLFKIKRVKIKPTKLIGFKVKAKNKKIIETTIVKAW